MAFENIEQINREFGFTDAEPDEIRKQLREFQARIHPDRHEGGNFASEADEERFYKAGEAIEFLQQYSDRQTALVPVTVVTDLMQTIQGLVPIYQTSSAETRLSEQVSERISEIGSQHRLPKITVSTITLILTALWVFPSVATEHPVLQQYMDISSPIFASIWVSSVLVTALMWIFFSVRENRQKRVCSLLKTERFQNGLFREFSSSIIPDKPFTRDDFINFLTSYSRETSNVELSQSIAEVVFARAEAKGIIKKDSQPSLSDSYTLVSIEF